jgi:hypothetical protein
MSYDENLAGRVGAMLPGAEQGRFAPGGCGFLAGILASRNSSPAVTLLSSCAYTQVRGLSYG